MSGVRTGGDDMRRTLVRGLIAAAVLMSFSTATYAATPVITCGASVVGVAELLGDLDCSNYAGHALTLDGTLKLNGHVLTGHADTLSSWQTVDCPGSDCKIKGPGTISGGAIGVAGRVRVKLTDVTVTGAHTGVIATFALIKSSHIIGNGQVVDDGAVGLVGGVILVPRRLVMVNSRVEQNGFYGVLGSGEFQSSIQVKGSTIIDNGNVAAFCTPDRLAGCADIVKPRWTVKTGQ